MALGTRSRSHLADRGDRDLGICLGDRAVVYPGPGERLNFPRSPVEVLSTWDGTHYSYIARNGYSTDGAAARRFSFFPLFPAISRLVGGAEHAVLAGILLNQLCLLISILLIGRLVEDGRPTQLSREPGFWILDDRFHETGSNGTGRLSRGFLVCA